jgi:hypothetical protein
MLRLRLAKLYLNSLISLNGSANNQLSLSEDLARNTKCALRRGELPGTFRLGKCCVPLPYCPALSVQRDFLSSYMCNSHGTICNGVFIDLASNRNDCKYCCGQHDGSLRQYSLFSRPKPLFFLPSSSSIALKWTPFQTHYLSENLVAPGIEPGPLDL